MESMNTFRCANGDYVLVPSSSPQAVAEVDGVVLPLLGRVTCGHLDEAVRRDIAVQLDVKGFARISRAKFFAVAPS